MYSVSMAEYIQPNLSSPNLSGRIYPATHPSTEYIQPNTFGISSIVSAWSLLRFLRMVFTLVLVLRHRMTVLLCAHELLEGRIAMLHALCGLH